MTSSPNVKRRRDAKEITEAPCAGPSDGRSVTRLITGMARAGTTWLCKSLNCHRDVAAFGESRFFAREYVEPDKNGTYDSETLQKVIAGLETRVLNSTMGEGPGCLKSLTLDTQRSIVREAFRRVTPPMTPAGVFLRLVHGIARAEGKPVPVEKTPQHVNWLDRIISALPGARFVVMIREPYGFMLSYKHQGDRKSPRVQRNYRRRYHPLGCAMVWRGYVRAVKAAERRYPGQTLVLRFEELVRDPEGVLDRVQRFFELQPVRLAGRVLPDNSSFPSGERPSLQPDDLFWMNLVARKEIRHYGVAPARVPFRPLPILKSVLRIPFWALWNVVDFRKRLPAGSAWRYLWRWMRPAG